MRLGAQARGVWPQQQVSAKTVELSKRVPGHRIHWTKSVIQEVKTVIHNVIACHCSSSAESSQEQESSEILCH